MWKANEKATALILFLDSLFPKNREKKTQFGRGYGPVARQITTHHPFHL
jgi:hypothetical protein